MNTYFKQQDYLFKMIKQIGSFVMFVLNYKLNKLIMFLLESVTIS